MTSDRLTEALAELRQVRAAVVRVGEEPVGGRSRTKRYGVRVDAKLKRVARLVEQARRLEREITALGGTVPPLVEPRAERPRPVVPVRPARPVSTPPTAMTDEDLRAADERMAAEKRASGAVSITSEHRAVKAELGRRSAIRTTRERRSAAGRKAAETRRKREALGLPPKRRSFSLNSEPPGGWTDADRVI